MIEKPTTLEIENMIARLEVIKAKWKGDIGYVRHLDIELHALKLLLIVTRIGDEEAELARTLGMEETDDDVRNVDAARSAPSDHSPSGDGATS
jgi:hypothetical protein